MTCIKRQRLGLKESYFLKICCNVFFITLGWVKLKCTKYALQHHVFRKHKYKDSLESL